MEIFTAKYEADGTITAGPMEDGHTYSSITPTSRFYATVMSLTDDGATIAPYAEELRPIPGVSRRQFFQQAAISGIITEDEALAAVTTGALPAVISAFIGTLPDDEQFGAKMLFAVNEFNRASPMANAFGSTLELTPEQVDAFFTDAAQL